MIRNYKSNDEKGINELFKEVFGKERSEKEWHWKFRKNPINKEIISVYEDNNKICGHVSVMPVKVQVGTEEKLFGMRADAMISPSSRGKGIYKDIVHHVVKSSKEEDVDFLYGFPAPKAKELFQKYTGAKELCYVPRLIYVNNPVKLAMTKLPASINKLPLVQSVGNVLRRRKALLKESPNLVPIKQADDRFDDLWERAKGQYPIMLKRDRAYVNWRYFENPTNKYSIIGYVDGGILKGYAVTAIQEKQINGVHLNLGYVVDIFAVDENEVWLKLIETSLRNLSNSDMISTWALKHTRLYSQLKGCGFIHKDSPMPFVGVSLQEGNNKANEIENWFITPGDVDSF
ncbi:GNAT family N-acetyltransferase [Halalkalibacter okhensis]|uniref:N-acetyltransferase domain-containing protein n=1 Tax=Halalkalibacter okhensis TaxID=333138 RepID=A0A0B0IAK1_9BACI|nr:GNAT family N-acetyltransferase [Halalkalibacter okhensis]KHF39598.1 hypothetical protein LQ50_14255 [Halalkalibacter okhensis]